MGKKRYRTNYTSKGGLGGRFLAGRSSKTPVEVSLNKWDAFLAGKKVYVTVPNSNPQNTKERWVRVEMSKLYGDYRKY